MIGGLLLLPILPVRVTGSVRAGVVNGLRAPLGWLSAIGEEIWAFTHWRQLAREVEALRRERDRLVGDVVRLEEASQENERLRSLLSFRETFDGKTVPARVMGRDPVRWSRSVLLDRGKRSGIRPGAAVITPAGLVGHVSEVGASSCKVVLLLDPDCRVAGLVQRTRESGLVIGGGDGRLRMLYLPETAGSQAGDLIVTAGLGGAYPKGLLIGTIRDLRREVDGLSATARVEPAINADRLEEVLVVLE